MRLVVRGGGESDSAAIERLAQRMVHPLCGLDSRVGFVLRRRPEPRFAVAGGQLSGVHRLLGQEEEGSYHIGGVGLTRSEALVRTLGESVERYCQLVAVATGSVPTHLATTDELRRDGDEFVDPEQMSTFTEEQYERGGFPFDRPAPGARYGWLAMRRVSDGRDVLVPAQLVLVGYGPHRRLGEPWLAPAMTTGTATHRTETAARRGALLELIQIDTAMGHWYGSGSARRILLGARLAAIQRLLDRWVGRTAVPTFHHIPSPDLPAHTVACLIRQPEGRRPVAVVGLGCEVRLAEACYKALLEAVGVLQLARIAMANAALDGEHAGIVADETQIYDLDTNVGHYADGGGAQLLASKFPYEETVSDADLAEDDDRLAGEVVDSLLESLLSLGISLFERDLTTADVRDLGLVTTRLWSPDLLALAMPSAPPMAHRRFAAHGGAVHRGPHPYP